MFDIWLTGIYSVYILVCDFYRLLSGVYRITVLVFTTRSSFITFIIASTVLLSLIHRSSDSRTHASVKGAVCLVSPMWNWVLLRPMRADVPCPACSKAATTSSCRSCLDARSSLSAAVAARAAKSDSFHASIALWSWSPICATPFVFLRPFTPSSAAASLPSSFSGLTGSSAAPLTLTCPFSCDGAYTVQQVLESQLERGHCPKRYLL